MAIYLIAVDMRAIGHDYLGFFNHVRQAGYHQALETSWLIETQDPLRALSDRLLALLAPGDGLLQVEISADAPWAATRLKDGTGAWLKQQRP
ncbi:MULTISPECIES: hypothetical protein [unclassified Methylobacterium]|uniref:hypothetical protein n=1 Tax=unclassified Methylobacterium TaxID=2615210 RepID=UPI002269A029|nr:MULTISPECIES: hypothetical protein [unclassified Methylobacterium]